MPEYATIGSSGLDIRANIIDGVKFMFNSTLDYWDAGIVGEEGQWVLSIDPGGRALIPTGLYIEGIETGVEAQIRSRSGLALKKGVIVLNSPATIDSDYTGELGVILANTGNEPFRVLQGDRIAQLVFTPVLIISDTTDKEERGDGGFGHTGKD